MPRSNAAVAPSTCLPLAAQERAALASFAQTIRLSSDPHSCSLLQHWLSSSSIELASIRPGLDALSVSGDLEHLLVTHLPQDNALPAPPSQACRPAAKNGWVSEVTLLHLARAAGLLPVAYREEKRGALIQEISPASGHATSLSSSGRISLGFHTDLAILKTEYRPEYLFLYGLINATGTPTLITSLDESLQALAKQGRALVQALRQPRFRIASPAILQVWGGKTIISEARPLVVQGDSGFEQIGANLNAVSACDPEAAQALQHFIALLPKLAKPVVIAPGTALLFNNQRCLHGRPAIRPGRRWLQRLYCRHNLELLRQATGSAADAHVFSLRQLILE